MSTVPEAIPVVAVVPVIVTVKTVEPFTLNLNVLLAETEPKKAIERNEVLKLWSDFQALKALTTAGV